jgi:hypothetical protein
MTRLIAACVFASFLFTSIAGAQPSASTSAIDHGPTSKPVIEALAREQAHFLHVKNRLTRHPELARNPYFTLELSVAKRFLDRISTGTGKGDKSADWRILQTDEIRRVLNHAEKTIDAVEQGRLPRNGLGPVPVPSGGAVKIVDGVFVTDTKIPGEAKPKARPFYFGGYGHFQQVINDLPNFHDLGVSLVQDGRNGPAQGLAPAPTEATTLPAATPVPPPHEQAKFPAHFALTPAGRAIEQMLQSAHKANVKVDILTSPHYFPAWAVQAAPDMANGSAFNNIDHPKQRQVIENWLSLLAKQNAAEPALLSYCLSNEPAYSASGRDPYSAPLWHEFLKQRHGTIEKLNQLYKTKFNRFEDVPASGWPDTPVGQRWAFDWVTFNDQHFARWHKWMGDVIKKQDPRALTHAKIMVFFSLDQDKLGWGIDPEQFCLNTDIAGCDAYAQQTVGVGPLDESTSKEYAYHWQVQEMCYDLLHSFADQPVFNSENHPLPNASGAYRWPSPETRAVIWQGGLHHQGATTTWVWEEGSEPSLRDSIYFRPAHIWQEGRALLDLNRLGEEVTAINRAKPTVAILYSPASRFWEKNYATAMRTVYTALNFLGETITFVSERQLAEGNIPPVGAIVLPEATHVTDVAAAALLDFARSGGKLLYYGQDCLASDQYDRPRQKMSNFQQMQTLLPSIALIDPGDERQTAGQMRKALPTRPLAARLVATGTNQPTWGIEFRTIEHEGKFLVPLINLLKQPQTVTISIDQAEDQALDLLTDQIVSLKNLKLAPMEPKLLKISRR